MTDRPIRYSEILDRCLAHEDKAHRDAVLAEFPENVQRIVRGLMTGIAKRLASYVRVSAKRERHLDRNVRRQRYRQRLDAIHPPWLRQRVATIAGECWERDVA